MTIVNRRNVWFVVIVALAAMLSVWVTASAASPPSRSSAPTTVQFRVTLVSGHNWGNFTTAGQSGQAEFKLLDAAGKQVGTVYWSATVLKRGMVMGTGEARFPNRGRIELQGVWPWSNVASSGGAIIGGTGVFSGVHGQSYYEDATGTVTLTYR